MGGGQEAAASKDNYVFLSILHVEFTKAGVTGKSAAWLSRF